MYRYSILLPGTTPEGYKVILCGHLPWDGRYEYKINMKRFMMQIDMWLSKIDVSNGLYLVIDSKNSSMSHYKSASFDAVKKLITYFQVIYFGYYNYDKFLKILFEATYCRVVK